MTGEQWSDFLPEDWFEVSESEVLTKSEDPFFVYSASKALAEKALWALAAQHPELDVTTSTLLGVRLTCEILTSFNSSSSVHIRSVRTGRRDRPRRCVGDELKRNLVWPPHWRRWRAAPSIIPHRTLR